MQVCAESIIMRVKIDDDLMPNNLNLAPGI